MVSPSKRYRPGNRVHLLVLTGLFLVGLLGGVPAHAAGFTLNVVDQDGAPVSGFRWMLQEDTSFVVEPGVQVPNPTDPDNYPLSMSFHKSYHPLAIGETSGTGLQGNTPDSSVTVADVPAPGPASGDLPIHYYVTVLPYTGYSLGGAPVVIDGVTDPTVTVVVEAHPIPTAQISIFLFHDHFPINNAPDLPEESDPGVGQPGHVDWTQFSITLEEPAGRYGASGGPMLQDAFGNPLGTAYDPVTLEPLLGPGDCPAREDGTCADGTLHPDENGFLTIKNLAPGKYGIIAVPPTDSGWVQTSTIEGTKVIDAWVKANEPAFFVEFGPPGPHVFTGFVKASADFVEGQTGGFPPLPGGDGAVSVSGTITDMHMSRPPDFTFYSGRAFPGCWVGLNEGGAAGPGIYAAPCNADSTFSIPDVPPGTYQLVVWDANLDAVFAFYNFTVDPTGGTCNGGQSCDFGAVAVFNWFARLNTSVFSDDNQNGFWDLGETGIGPESQGVNLRWRDGTIYQSFPTDGEGFAPFDEVFPFFHWLVAEVSFTNKKATGATFVVDAGGPVDTSVDTFPGFGELTPQPQCVDDGTGTGATVGYDPVTGTCPAGSEDINPNTGDNLSRTVVGPVLTQAFQAFLGQTNVLQFGKTDYTVFTPFDFTNDVPTGGDFVGENGGISGIVFYATTRAEDDPRYAVGETWEPGIPRVQLALYADGDIDCFPTGNFPADNCDIDWNGNGVLDGDDNLPDDVNGNGLLDLADVDNHPQGNFPGPEDVDYNTNTLFDLGDAVQVAYTDSWDDSLPTGCQGLTFFAFGDDRFPTDCFDGLRNFNQLRPGVFDGGYAFADYALAQLPQAIQDKLNAFYAAVRALPPVVPGTLVLGDTLPEAWLLPADYIVAAATPPGYELVREEDKNVDLGDTYVPSAQALPADCIGELHTVPRYLTLQTVPDTTGLEPDGRLPVVPEEELIAAPFTGEDRPLCDRKRVTLGGGQNAATDFFLYTEVPVVANASGVILNDLANEFNPNSPTFGEKFAPPWLPVAFYDWNGKLLNRVYADQFGRYNAVLPSTYTVNLPQPSGVSPNMVVSCKNDAGPIPNPAYDPVTNPDVPQNIIDPFFDPQYSQFCYTFQYMPGVTTYLDTPVLPIAAFAGPGQFPVDCERPPSTPMISGVRRIAADGGGGPFVVPGQHIRILSLGLTTVLNPVWDGVSQLERTIERDYGFGDIQGTAELEDAAGNRVALPISLWNDGSVIATVPETVAPGHYQVVVTSSGGVESGIGVTLSVGTVVDGVELGVRPDGTFYRVRSVGPNGSIQAVIDAARPGDLILVGPGVYEELVIMWKPVKLQGWGAGMVTLNARQVPTEKVAAWRAKAEALVADGSISLLPGQTLAPLGFPALGAPVFPTEEGAGIFVAGRSPEDGNQRFDQLRFSDARVDGFTIVGASTGGGLVVNGYAANLSIGNNRITANNGFYGGGIRVGHPQLSHEDPDLGLVYDDAANDNIRIHHNQVIKNGGLGGAGGGVSINTGTDNYKVQRNWICGNFNQGDGGGIGHLGLSDNGLIADNYVLFNESFDQGLSPAGGGIFIGGQVGLAPDATTGLTLTPGTGNVTIDANLIRGNLAGAHDGGGIRVVNVNGMDIVNSLDDVSTWYRVEVHNNMITNNVTGLAGGGISIEEALRVRVINNTVVNNDSTATAALAFQPGVANQSVPQPAGIVSRAHAPDLAALLSLFVTATLPDVDWLSFSDPTLRDDIVHHNRSFFWLNFDDPATPEIESGLFPASCASAPDTTGPGCNPVNDADQFSNDLAVLGGPVGALLNPRFSLLTSVAGYNASNIEGDPAFVNGYFNGSRDQFLFPEFKVIQAAGAFDEGGNFLQVAFGPLSLLGADGTTLFDYHLTAQSDAIDVSPDVPTGLLTLDYDNDVRPAGVAVDLGADEAQ